MDAKIQAGTGLKQASPKQTCLALDDTLNLLYSTFDPNIILRRTWRGSTIQLDDFSVSHIPSCLVQHATQKTVPGPTPDTAAYRKPSIAHV